MISIQKVSSESWKACSADAHLIAFQQIREASMERIDFALVAAKDGVVAGYVTCREFDSETLYWQFGGTFPGARKTSVSWLVYMAGLNWGKGKYKRIVTLIENTNSVMLKFAMKAGFLIQGIRVFEGTILLEHILEFKDV